MKRSPAIKFVLITVLIDVMSIGLMLPVVPALVGEFAGSREAQSYWYGALLLAFGTMQFLCAPLLGALSDRYGRRPVLLVSIATLGVMHLLSALVTSLPALLATRILGGAMAANFSVASAYVADLSTPENRAKSFGLIGAAFGVGFIVGPMLGGLLGAIDIRLPFYVAAAFALANFAYGVFVLPESLPRDRRTAVDWRRANPLGALLGLARLAQVGPLVAVIALSNLAQFILHSVWVLYGTFRFGWGPKEAGISLFVVGVMTAVVQGGLLGRLLKWLGEPRCVILGIASAMLAYAGYGLAAASWVVYAIIVANVLAYTIGPALSAVVSRAADPREQGIAMGSLTSLASLMAVIAPLLGTPLLAEVSHLPPSDWRVGAPFFLSAALMLIALVLAAWHFARGPRRAAPHVARGPAG